MDWEHREIFQEEEDSDNEFNQSENLDEDEKQEYCFGSVPMSKLQPRKVLSSARWVSEMRMADVEVQKGPIWRTTGIARRGKIYCSVEEVLFLVELGALILMDDSGAITSVEEVYAKLSDEKNGCCWDYFQAYRQLKSLGYIVGRHGIPWSLKSVIGNIEYSVPQCLVKNAADSKAEAESKAEVCLSVMLSRMQIDEAKPVFDVYLPNSKFRKSCPGDPSFVICFTRGYPPSKETVEFLDRQCRGVPLKFCHVEQGKKINTLDNVQLSNLHVALSPHCCPLCNPSAESINHLFIRRSLSGFIWNQFLCSLGMTWVKDRELQGKFSILDCSGKSIRWRIAANVAILVSFWGTWEQRNKRIFEDKFDTVEAVWERINHNIALWLFSKNKEFEEFLFFDLIRNWNLVL